MTRLPLSMRAGERRILLVETTCDRVETRFRGFNGDAGRQAHDCQELLGIALMQHVVRELRSERGRRGDRNEQLRGIDGKGAIEILRRDSHDGRDLSVQAKHLADGVGRGVEAIAPETIADHHHGRITGLVKFGAKHSSTLGLHAEHGKIIG